LLGRRSPLLKLQGDERLVALIRDGNEHAFEALFDRYHSRLLAFCRHMLRSAEDAEDVLQEVFVKAHAAMLADERPINARPWLYRIARNRCLNHLRRPVADGVDTMDVLPSENGVTTAERVQKREDFRCLVEDVSDLPETQRTALLLREIDALSYEEIATAMDTTVPAVKSLLVRARMSLAEATHSRQLTCGEVRLELAEAAEGLRKASGPVRHHIKRCEPCQEFRGELRHNSKALAALAPLGPLAVLHHAIVGKLSGLFGGSGSAAGGSTAAGSGAAAIGAGGTATTAGGIATAGAGGTGAAVGGGAAFGGAAAGGLGGALGAKAAVTAATAALITAGAVEVREISRSTPEAPAAKTAFAPPPAHGRGGLDVGAMMKLETTPATPAAPAQVVDKPSQTVTEPAADEVETTLEAPVETAPPTEAPPTDEGVVGPPSETPPGSLETGEAEATNVTTVAEATQVTTAPGATHPSPQPTAAPAAPTPAPEPAPVNQVEEPGPIEATAPTAPPDE